MLPEGLVKVPPVGSRTAIIPIAAGATTVMVRALDDGNVRVALKAAPVAVRGTSLSVTHFPFTLNSMDSVVFSE
jgi:hypothetical protein